MGGSNDNAHVLQCNKSCSFGCGVGVGVSKAKQIHEHMYENHEIITSSESVNAILIEGSPLLPPA